MYYIDTLACSICVYLLLQNQLENGKAGFWQIKLESEDVTSVAQLQIEKPSEIHPAPTGSVLEDELEPEYYIIYHTLIKQDVQFV